jgi:5-methylcytosine-specific restriction protein A
MMKFIPQNLVVMSRKANIDASLQDVSDALGVVLKREFMSTNHDYEVKIRLEQIPYPHGFNIKIYDDYLNWRLELQLDVFTAPLMAEMQKRFNQQRDTFASYLELAKLKSNKFTFQVNQDEDIFNLNGDWSEIHFSLTKSYYSEDLEFQTLTTAALDFMCIILFLIIDDTEWTVEIEDGEEEGASYFSIVKKYERSRYNRALCLKYYGFTCKGCGDKLEQKYGPIGSDVIHVHHIVPISQMGSSYKLNPIKDLIPLCPNCHNIVHKQNPPLEILELQKLTSYQSQD